MKFMRMEALAKQKRRANFKATLLPMFSLRLYFALYSPSQSEFRTSAPRARTPGVKIPSLP